MRPRFANRGSNGSTGDGEGGLPASMRPRFANRGSAPFSSFRRGSRRRFNEAPIRESGKSLPWAKQRGYGYRASMRPRFANRGSGSGIGNPECVSIASMRPRFANRGSVAYRLPDCVIGKASMRPRFANRGSENGASDLAATVVLQ